MDEAPHLSLLVQIEGRALAAQTLPALHFTIVNETHALTPYRQAVLFEAAGSGLRPVAASGLVSVAVDSPFIVWLGRFAARLPRDGAIHRLDCNQAAPEDRPGWEEWLPAHLLWAPIKAPGGAILAMGLYAREEPWTEAETALVERLHLAYGLCLAALSPSRTSLRPAVGRLVQGRRRLMLPALLALVLVLPVRMSVLAPAEVAALNAMAVAAPQDGVIGSFAIAPNSRVKAGDLLFSLDDTVLRNRREVAAKSLEIARADAHLARQRAFDDLQGRADLALTAGRVKEKEAELAAVEAQLQQVGIRAEQDGLAVFADANDWLGRPVQTGERVMQLARPEDAGVLVWLAVADAINLEAGAPVQLFLHTDPLRSRSGRLIEASYQAVTSPEGIASYRLRARFDEAVGLPRIGLRGTARIAGERVSLGYYLFRRPIAQIREWTGL